MTQTSTGSIFGAILLIGGCCIGGGMLALPAITGIGGFFPSAILFVIAWLFMAITSLLLLEANLTLGYHLSMISISERALGNWGKILCWFLFIFLFYSINVAYISASGTILRTVSFELFGVQIAPWLGSLLFTVIFGLVLYLGTQTVDYLNRILMIGLIAAYVILIFLAAKHVKLDYLLYQNWKYSIVSLPILVISFGFHNMIPSLAEYLKGDVRRLRLAVFVGSLVPLLIYLLWNLVMLGLTPPGLRLEFMKQGTDATQILYEMEGPSWITFIVQAFGLFAVITTFLAVSLSLVDFLADGLKMSKKGINRLILVLLTLFPPFIFALIYPNVFLKALNIAGGFAAVVLFGILPVCMIWNLRYIKKISLAPVIPSGKYLLCLVFLLAFVVFCFEVAQEFGWSLLPKDVEGMP